MGNNMNNNRECKFKVGDRVKLSKEALEYAKSPADLQRWKKDRGEVTEIHIREDENNDPIQFLIRASFSDEYLKTISFLESQLKKSKD